MHIQWTGSHINRISLFSGRNFGLVEAAEQLRAFACYFLCDLHVGQIQLDELYAVLSAVKGGELSEDEAIRRLSRSPQWVWTAMDPETKLEAIRKHRLAKK